MGHSQVSRAYQEVERSPQFIPHHRLLADRWTGVVRLRWRVARDYPLAVGAGWFSLRGGEPPPDRPLTGLPRRVQQQRATPIEVVAEIVRRGAEGTPIIPGSSLKGAVRQVYELLTPSCLRGRPMGATRLRVSPNPGSVPPALCSARAASAVAPASERRSRPRLTGAGDWRRARCRRPGRRARASRAPYASMTARER